MGGIYTARSPLRECLMSHNHEPAAGDRPEEAPHAFFADYRPSDREQAARDAWARCLDWFKKHGLS